MHYIENRKIRRQRIRNAEAHHQELIELSDRQRCEDEARYAEFSLKIRNAADHTYTYLLENWEMKVPRGQLCDLIWKNRAESQPARKKSRYANDYDNQFEGDYMSEHDNRETQKHR